MINTDLTTINVTQSMPIPYEYPDHSYSSITYEVKASYVLKEQKYMFETDEEIEDYIRGTVESAVSMAIFNRRGAPITELPKALDGIEKKIGEQTRIFCDFKEVELVRLMSVKNPE